MGAYIEWARVGTGTGLYVPVGPGEVLTPAVVFCRSSESADSRERADSREAKRACCWLLVSSDRPSSFPDMVKRLTKLQCCVVLPGRG